MARRSVFLSLLSALFLVCWVALPASAQEQEVRPPSQQVEAGVEFTKRVPVEDVTPSEDNQKLRTQARKGTREGRPFVYGKVISTAFTPEQHGVWERLPSGDWLWRIGIRSEEAVSLSLGFSPFELPAGAELFVHGPGDSVVRGPYRTEGRAKAKQQTPIVRTEEVIVELMVPSQSRDRVNIKIDHVVHAFDAVLSSPPRAGGHSLRKSGACNVDVACEQGWAWDQQIRSVARYTFRIGDGAALCSGSLVNNTGDTTRPYFLTAEHCVPTAEIAESMTFYWNYQSRTCRRPGSEESGSPLPITERVQVSTGATMRARYGNVHNNGNISNRPDLTLVEINDGDNDGMENDADDNDFLADYNLYLNGWNRTGNTTEGLVGIHHPAGHAKRISINRDPTTLAGFNASGTTHLQFGRWEVGTTEGGSSGSPAFNDNKRVVGVLSGGVPTRICGGGTEEGSAGNVLYGRLAPGFEKGDYPNLGGFTMADFLDPENTGQNVLEGREMSPDTEAPAEISSFRLEQANKTSVTLAWEAPGDDGTGGGAATRYAVRYSVNEPINTFEDFKDAQPVRDVPSPASPGTAQSVSVDVDSDSSYYFGIVAFDDVLRHSPVVTLEDGLVGTASVRALPVAPNPARQQARAAVAVEKAQSVQVGLYDALGRRVKLLLDREVEPYREIPVRIDVSSLSSGMYFLRVVGETGSSTQQVPVVK